MIHDEKTTEIEIPPKNSTAPAKPVSRPTPSPVENKVENKQASQLRQTHAQSGAVAVAHQPFMPHAKSIARARHAWLKELDITEPWLIRLIAVLSILLLSILVL